MNQYKYVFERGSKKHFCPNPECGKKKFVRYVDTETGAYLPERYGKCDREINCGYYLNPYQDGYGLNRDANKTDYRKSGHGTKCLSPLIKHPLAFIPNEVFRNTLRGFDQNTFIQNLLKHVPYPFEAKDIEQIKGLYYLGTVSLGYMTRAVTFPFIDIEGGIRAIQVKQFNKANHTTRTSFLHSVIKYDLEQKRLPLPAWLTAYLKNDLRVSCLFGEHLLSKYPNNPIALVEAPKTAVYGSLYFGFPEEPENYLWLAVYNLTSLTFEKCKALKGRKVYLFPDLSKPNANKNCYQVWKKKATELSGLIPDTLFKVSNLLEENATETERKQGLDLADYLEKLDWKTLRKKQLHPVEKPISKFPEARKLKAKEQKEKLPLPLIDQNNTRYGEGPTGNLSSPHRKENVADDTAVKIACQIKELECFFETASYPSEPIRLNHCSTIADTKQFVRAHLAIIYSNLDKRVILPYLERLYQLKVKIEGLPDKGC